MAITVLAQPTTPNVTGTRLLYSLSSTNVTQPQFQYVADIYQGSNLVTRQFIYPNTAGSGNFDIARILSDNLEYDDDWKTTTSISADDSYKTFTLAFSESYATSISSSTSVTAGGASSTLQVFPGQLEPTYGSFNWQDSGSVQLLTNQTQGYLSKGNYVTFTVYEPPNDTTDYTVSFISASGDVLGSTTVGGGSSPNSFIANFGFGSGSALFVDRFETTDWETITITFEGESTPRTTYNRVRQCNGEGVTFAFINNYGFYDYYSIKNPVRENTEVERNTFTRTNVNYEAYTPSYDISRRGEIQYNTGYTDRYEVTTDYIDQAVAQWLTEMLDSPEVYIQENGNFIPVIITNSTYIRNTNTARQKLFQYTIQYKYANQRYSR